MRIAVFLLVAATAAIPAASGTFTMTLDTPRSPMAVSGSSMFNATYALDCQTALSWRAASAGAETIPIAVTAGGSNANVFTPDAATVVLATAPCTTPNTTQTSVTKPYRINALAGAPGLTPMDVWLHAVMPAAAVAGNTVVASQDANKSVSVQVGPVLAVSAQTSATSFGVAAEVFDFNVTFTNQSNVALQLIFNLTGEAVVEAPVVSLGTPSIPGSGPGNVTAPFRFHAPLGSWSKVTLRIEAVPQLQTIDGALHGSGAQVVLEFNNQMPAKKSPAPAAPAMASLFLAIAALAARKR